MKDKNFQQATISTDGPAHYVRDEQGQLLFVVLDHSKHPKPLIFDYRKSPPFRETIPCPWCGSQQVGKHDTSEHANSIDRTIIVYSSTKVEEDWQTRMEKLTPPISASSKKELPPIVNHSAATCKWCQEKDFAIKSAKEEPFYGIQLFDEYGYITTLFGNSKAEVQQLTSQFQHPNTLAHSLPFEGRWHIVGEHRFQDVRMAPTVEITKDKRKNYRKN